MAKVVNKQPQAILQQWRIWYTMPRAEKQVFKRLHQKSVEVYLPLRKEIREWSDRKKLVETPLFSGYIFTYISIIQLDIIKSIPGILNYVRMEGKPAVLSDEQIRKIQLFTNSTDSIETEDIAMVAGEAIRIIAGPFKGLSGELISHRGKNKFAVRIEELGKMLLAELPKDYIKKKEKVEY